MPLMYSTCRMVTHPSQRFAGGVYGEGLPPGGLSSHRVHRHFQSDGALLLCAIVPQHVPTCAAERGEASGRLDGMTNCHATWGMMGSHCEHGLPRFTSG